MRLLRAHIHNMGPFTDFHLNLEDHAGATLIAVTGDNGAGKTTLLELAIPGALYRKTPTRGTLVELATARDSFVASTLELSGHVYTIRHGVDSIARTVETLVTSKDQGALLPASTKLADFKAWAALVAPPEDLALASMFAPQKSEGFLGASKGERKGILLRALGIERFERQAKYARGKADHFKGLADVARAKLTELKASTGDAAEIRPRLEAAETKVAELTSSLEAARKHAAELTASAEKIRKDSLERTRLEILRADDIVKRNALQQRLEATALLRSNAEQIRAAVATLLELRPQLETATLRKTENQSLEREGFTVRGTLEINGKKLAADKAGAEDRIRALELTIEKATQVDQAVQDQPGAQAKASTLMAEAELAIVALQVAERAERDTSGSRILGLRDGLQQIRRGATDDTITAGETLDTDDAAAARDYAQEREQAAASSRAATSTELQARGTLERLNNLAVQAPEVERATESKAVELETVERLDAEIKEARDGYRVENTKAEALLQERSGLNASISDLTERIALADPVAKSAGDLDRAEATIAEINPQIAELGTRIEGYEIPQRAELPDTVEADRRVLGFELDLAEWTATATVAHSELEQAESNAERLGTLTDELATNEDELADWNRLAADTGRDGLQAVEIDAAGPELTDLANKLLHNCHGPRFSVSIDTAVLSADGKRELEGCSVRVLDTLNGCELEGARLSGGEAVIVGEAISDALALVAIDRSGVKRPTLIRDESGAALHPHRVPVFAAMLRYAANEADAQVLFVSHVPAAIQLADVEIEISTTAA